jgi:hypothetical protein
MFDERMHLLHAIQITALNARHIHVCVRARSDPDMDKNNANRKFIVKQKVAQNN